MILYIFHSLTLVNNDMLGNFKHSVKESTLYNHSGSSYFVWIWKDSRCESENCALSPATRHRTGCSGWKMGNMDGHGQVIHVKEHLNNGTVLHLQSSKRRWAVVKFDKQQVDVMCFLRKWCETWYTIHWCFGISTCESFWLIPLLVVFCGTSSFYRFPQLVELFAHWWLLKVLVYYDFLSFNPSVWACVTGEVCVRANHSRHGKFSSTCFTAQTSCSFRNHHRGLDTMTQITSRGIHCVINLENCTKIICRSNTPIQFVWLTCWLPVYLPPPYPPAFQEAAHQFFQSGQQAYG